MACVEKIVNVVCHSMMSNNLAYTYVFDAIVRKIRERFYHIFCQ